MADAVTAFEAGRATRTFPFLVGLEVIYAAAGAAEVKPPSASPDARDPTIVANASTDVAELFRFLWRKRK